VQKTKYFEKTSRIEKFLDDIKKMKDQFKFEEFIIPNSEFILIDCLYKGKETKLVEKFNCLICLKIINTPVQC